MIKIINEVNFDKWEEENNLGDIDEEWVLHIPKECIKGASLLTVEEFEKYKNIIPELDSTWWLMNSNDDSNEDNLFMAQAPCVYDNKVIKKDVDSSYTEIRVALRLDLTKESFKPGETFEFGYLSFIILSKDLAISEYLMGCDSFSENPFSKDANKYENSRVKHVIDNWFDFAYSEYE